MRGAPPRPFHVCIQVLKSRLRVACAEAYLLRKKRRFCELYSSFLREQKPECRSLTWSNPRVGQAATRPLTANG